MIIHAQIFNTQEEAEASAWAKSIFDDCFYYVFRNSLGKYIVDIIGLVNSDETLVCIYYKGERQIYETPTIKP